GAGGPRRGAGAFRPDMQDAAGIDPRDRAAAGADRGDVEAAQRDAVAGDLAVHDERRLAVHDEADVGTRAAHIEGDQVRLAEEARRVDAARGAAGRARQNRAGGKAPGLADRGDAAMRLDDQGRAAIAGLGEARFQPREIARQHRADIGVDDRRRDPLELLDLRQDRGGQRDIGVGERAGERLARLTLVTRVAPGVQIADRDRFDALALEHGDRSFERGWVERRVDAAIGADALTYRQAQPARHELLGRRHAEVVAVILQPLAHLDDIAVAFGGEETEPCALVFEERIRRDGRAVNDALGVAKQRGAVDPEAAGQLRKAFDHPKRGSLRRRRDFGERRQTALVDRDKIGEGAADIDADAIVHILLNLPAILGRDT